MRFVNAEEVHARLDYPGLVEALRALFDAASTPSTGWA